MKRFCFIDWYKISVHDLQACTEIIVCSVGVGALTMAYAIAQAGPLYGAIAIALMCFFNIYATILLSKVLANSPAYVETYSDLGFYIAGAWGRRAVEFSQLLACLLLPIAYLIIGGTELLPGIFNGVLNLSSIVWTILMAIFLLPFALIRNLKEAFWVMILGTATAIFAIFGSIGQTAQTRHWDAYEASEVQFSNVLTVFGNLALAYGASLVVPAIQRNHPEPKKVPMNAAMAMLITTCIYSTIAIFGYAQFGCSAPNNMLLSMKNDGWKIAVYISMQLHVMISSAVILNPVLFVIERFVLGKSENVDPSDYNGQVTPLDKLPSVTTDLYDSASRKSSRSSVYSIAGDLNIRSEQNLKDVFSMKDKIKSYALRTLVVGIQTFLALLGQSCFGDFVSFIGATTLTASCMILPCIFYYKKFRLKMSLIHKVFCWMVIIISAILGVYTAYKKMENIISMISKYKLFALVETAKEQNYPFCPTGYLDRHPLE